MSRAISNHGIHLVFGPPAAGKTTYARRLAAEIGGAVFDSDQVAERLVRAGMSLAGMNPNDRDSAAYKTAFRDAVYETLFDLACTNSTHLPVIIAGPFTSEGGDSDWPGRLEKRIGTMPTFHFVWCPPSIRKERIRARNEPRDLPKLADWDAYVATCREEPPVFPHHWVDSSLTPI